MFVHVCTYVICSSGATVGILFASGLSSFTFNYTLNFGILYTSPLFMRLSTVCTIPVSLLFSVFVFHTTPNPPHALRIAGYTYILCVHVLYS